MENKAYNADDGLKGHRAKTEADKLQNANENDEPGENLGLDADSSSEGPSLITRLNDDNDRISGNPDGEDDEPGESAEGIYSPLDDK